VGSLHWLRKKKAALLPYLMLKKTFQFLSGGVIGDSDFVLVLKKTRKECDWSNNELVAKIPLPEKTFA
jgi:hypothetical protein